MKKTILAMCILALFLGCKKSDPVPHPQTEPPPIVKPEPPVAPPIAEPPAPPPERPVGPALDNGTIRLRLGTEYGGSIVHLGLSDGPNLINNFDRGRQIQQSYYAGRDIVRPGQHDSWSPWAWNPIQSGDVYGNQGRIVEMTLDGHSAYVKTVPAFWERDGVYCESCTMETWITLDKNKAHVRSRFEIGANETGIGAVIPRHQELPAIYTVSSLGRLVTYLGDSPCTGGSPIRITKKTIPDQPDMPWNYWPSPEYPGASTEMWAAATDSSLNGIGIVSRDAELFIGGKYGSSSTNPFASPTTYFSPLRTVGLGPGSVLESSYTLIVGHVDEIRAYACEGR